MLVKHRRKRGTSTIWGIILSLIAAIFMFPLIQYIQTKQEFHGTVEIIQAALKEATTKVTVQNYDDLKSGVITVREMRGTKTYNIASMIMENIGSTEIADDQYLLTDSGYKVQILEVNARQDKNISLEMKYRIIKEKAVLGLLDIDATKRAYGILQTKCPHETTVVQDADLLYSGDKVCAACGEVVEKGKLVVPEGGRYTRVVSYKTYWSYATPDQVKVLSPGEEVPSLKACDRLEYNGYVYMYKAIERRVSISDATKTLIQQEDITGDGWSVQYANATMSQPVAFVDYIGQKPVTTMYETYAGIYMREAPELPDTIINMYGAFQGAPISTVEKLPSFVQVLDYTFANCTSLVDCSNLIIPDTVTTMSNTFNSCSGLRYAPKLPPRVKCISRIFENCSNLTKAPYVPEGVTNMDIAFAGCSKIIVLNIPSTVTEYMAAAAIPGKITIYYSGTDLSKIHISNLLNTKQTTATIYTGYDGYHILGS